jgi:glycosyltransferase involved in cell wall biosynthesis
LVLDDASTDRTGEIIRIMATQDTRVRLVQTQTLPAGWNGKQRACWLLAQETDAPLMLFLDADVRLAPDALYRCVAEMDATGIALLSGFPRQITIGWMEQILLPLIHFVLLSFLPMGRMRCLCSGLRTILSRRACGLFRKRRPCSDSRYAPRRPAAATGLSTARVPHRYCRPYQPCRGQDV